MTKSVLSARVRRIGLWGTICDIVQTISYRALRKRVWEDEPRIEAGHPSLTNDLLLAHEQRHQSPDVARAGHDKGVRMLSQYRYISHECTSYRDPLFERERVEGRFVLSRRSIHSSFHD